MLIVLSHVYLLYQKHVVFVVHYRYLFISVNCQTSAIQLVIAIYDYHHQIRQSKAALNYSKPLF